MHDYFEILGVSRDARPSEIRRACRRRTRTAHPDICDGDAVPLAKRSGGRRTDRLTLGRDFGDAAIDFLDAASFVDSMQAGFFSE